MAHRRYPPPPGAARTGSGQDSSEIIQILPYVHNAGLCKENKDKVHTTGMFNGQTQLQRHAKPNSGQFESLILPHRDPGLLYKGLAPTCYIGLV